VTSKNWGPYSKYWFPWTSLHLAVLGTHYKYCKCCQVLPSQIRGFLMCQSGRLITGVLAVVPGTTAKTPWKRTIFAPHIVICWHGGCAESTVSHSSSYNLSLSSGLWTHFIDRPWTRLSVSMCTVGQVHPENFRLCHRSRAALRNIYIFVRRLRIEIQCIVFTMSV